MGSDVHEVVNVALDEKVEAPILVDAGLPQVLALVVLPGVQGRVVQVLEQKIKLLIASFLNDLGAALKLF